MDINTNEVNPLSIVGTPDDIAGLLHKGDDSDRIAAFGWRTIAGKFYIHLAFLAAALLPDKVVRVVTHFMPKVNYIGFAARTRLDTGRILTVASTTADGYADTFGFKAAVAVLMRWAGFDGLHRADTESNVIGLMTKSSTDLIVVTGRDKDTVLPALTDKLGQIVTYFVDVNGRVLAAICGTRDVLEIDLNALEIDPNANLTWKKIFETDSPIVEFTKPGIRTAAFEIVTTNGIVPVQCEDAVYSLDTDATIDLTDDTGANTVGFLGGSVQGYYGLTERNDKGGKDVMVLVPKNDLPESLLTRWTDDDEAIQFQNLADDEAGPPKMGAPSATN